MTTHPGCAVCSFWEERIAEEMRRVLAGVPGALDKERHARRELADHRERAKSTEVAP